MADCCASLNIALGAIALSLTNTFWIVRYMLKKKNGNN